MRGRPPLDCASPGCAKHLLDAGATAATDAALAFLSSHRYPDAADKSRDFDSVCARVLALLPKPTIPGSGNMQHALCNSLKYGHRATTLALLACRLPSAPPSLPLFHRFTLLRAMVTWRRAAARVA